MAQEVRALAQRSAAAAKEIKTLIAASGKKVEDGVGLVNRTGGALRSIVGKVSGINELISEIAASAEEESAGLAEVNTAVNQMDQVTQQNAAMVEETTAATRSLAAQAQDLNSLIAGFKLGSDERGAPAARRPPPPQRAAPPRPAPPLKGAMKTVDRAGGAAPKPAPSLAATAWEEF